MRDAFGVRQLGISGSERDESSFASLVLLTLSPGPRSAAVWVATLCSTLFYYQSFSQSYASYQRRRLLEIPMSATGTPRPSAMYDSSAESTSGRLLRMAFRPIPGIRVGSWVINSPAIGSPSRPGGAFSPRMSFDAEAQRDDAMMMMMAEHERPQRPALPSWLFGSRSSSPSRRANDDVDDGYYSREAAPQTPSLMVSPPTPSTPLPDVAGDHHAAPSLTSSSSGSSGSEFPVTPGYDGEHYRAAASHARTGSSPHVAGSGSDVDSDGEQQRPSESRRTLAGLGMGDLGPAVEGKTSMWMAPRRAAAASAAV